jgi:hypothetical protein
MWGRVEGAKRRREGARKQNELSVRTKARWKIEFGSDPRAEARWIQLKGSKVGV